MKTRKSLKTDTKVKVTMTIDRDVRLKRMEYYLLNTHQAFVVNLKRAGEFDMPSGVLAGPVAKRTNERAAV